MLSKLINYVVKKIKARIFRPLSKQEKQEIEVSQIKTVPEKPLVIKYKTEKGHKLIRNKDSDACFDICTCEAVTLRKSTRTKLKTGVYIEIPQGYEIQVRSRSGLAHNHGIFVINSPGTIDAGYRGELQVLLYNSGLEDFRIEAGNKIAQLKLERVIPVIFEETNEINLETDRGDKGFGSSGV